MKRILFETFTDCPHSYSIVHYFLLKYLKLDDYEILVKKLPFLNDAKMAEGETETFDGLGLREYNGETVDVIYRAGYPYNCKPDLISPDAKLIIFYTSEFGRFDPSQFNLSYDEIIANEKLFFVTPSRKSDCNFKDRCFVLNHGVDSSIYHPVARPKNSKFHLLNVSAGSKNKNLDRILLAFNELLKEGADIHLTLKINSSVYINTAPDYIKDLSAAGMIDADLVQRNLTVNTDNLTFAEMNLLYNSADGYVSGGCNEAWDMCVSEASAVGLPVILPDLHPQIMSFPWDHLVYTKRGQIQISDFVEKMRDLVGNNLGAMDCFKSWEMIGQEFADILSQVNQSE